MSDNLLLHAYEEAWKRRHNAAREPVEPAPRGQMFSRIHDRLDAEANDMAEFGPPPPVVEIYGTPAGDDYDREPQDMFLLGVGALLVAGGLLVLGGAIAIFAVVRLFGWW